MSEPTQSPVIHLISNKNEEKLLLALSNCNFEDFFFENDLLYIATISRGLSSVSVSLTWQVLSERIIFFVKKFTKLYIIIIC